MGWNWGRFPGIRNKTSQKDQTQSLNKTKEKKSKRKEEKGPTQYRGQLGHLIHHTMYIYCPHNSEVYAYHHSKNHTLTQWLVHNWFTQKSANATDLPTPHFLSLTHTRTHINTHLNKKLASPNCLLVASTVYHTTNKLGHKTNSYHRTNQICNSKSNA